MIEKYEGIVLRVLKYNDSYNVADVYTASRGRLSYLVPAASSGGRRGKVSRLLFRPMSLIEYESDYRPKSRLHYIREARLWHPYASLPFDPCKSAIAMFLAEFLSHALRQEGEGEASFFAYLRNALLWLDAAQGGFANFHLLFLLHFSRFAGIEPNVDGYRPGCRFDMLNGCFVSLPAWQQQPMLLSPDDSLALWRLMRMTLGNMHRFRFAREQRSYALSLMNDYYRLHLPDFPQLKSLDVLRQLF